MKGVATSIRALALTFEVLDGRDQLEYRSEKEAGDRDGAAREEMLSLAALEETTGSPGSSRGDALDLVLRTLEFIIDGGGGERQLSGSVSCWNLEMVDGGRKERTDDLPDQSRITFTSDNRARPRFRTR